MTNNDLMSLIFAIHCQGDFALIFNKAVYFRTKRTCVKECLQSKHFLSKGESEFQCRKTKNNLRTCHLGISRIF